METNYINNQFYYPYTFPKMLELYKKLGIELPKESNGKGNYTGVICCEKVVINDLPNIK